MQDLPIVGTRGRNPLDSWSRSPAWSPARHTGGGIHVNGARDRSWNYTLDGIDVNDSSQGGSNTTSFRVNPDMLDEMRSLTGNNTAENGRNSGGQVAMVTRSGTNELPRRRLLVLSHAAAQRQRVAEQSRQPRQGAVAAEHLRRRHRRPHHQEQDLLLRAGAGAARALQRHHHPHRLTPPPRAPGILRYVKGGRNQPAGVAGASVDAAGNVLPGLSIGTYNVAQNDPQHIGLDPTVRARKSRSEPLPNNFTVGDGLNTAGYIFSAQASRAPARSDHQDRSGDQQHEHRLRPRRLGPRR